MPRLLSFGRLSLHVLLLWGVSGVSRESPAAEPAFARKVSYRASGVDSKGELRWNSANRSLSLHDSDGKPVAWPASIDLTDPKPQPAVATAVESPRDVVAILGFRERLSGQIESVVDQRKIIWTWSGSTNPVTVDPASAFAWAFNPGKVTLLYRSFESADDAATFEPSFPAPQGRRMLRLAGVRREAADRYGVAIADQGLIQVAFSESQNAGEHGPLTISVHTAAADAPFLSVSLNSVGDTWEISSPQDERSTVSRLPRQPGIHRFSLSFGEGRVRFCVDESVAHTIRMPETSGPLAAVSISAPADRPRSVDALAAFAFGTSPQALQWPIDDDSLRFADGNEWLGLVESLDDDEWRVRDGESEHRLPLGMTSTWIPASRSAAGQWALGQVFELTFFAPVRSLWRSELDDPYFKSLGHSTPPGRLMDRVEGAVEKFDENGIALRLSQGGSITVPLERIVTIEPRNAIGLRVLDARPRHLGDEVDLRVIPPDPLGNRFGFAFEAGDEEAGWPLELAVDVVEVLGAGSPRFGDLIKKGELITEVRIGDKLLGTLNEKVTADNESPERIRFDIPQGTIRKGENRIEFLQKGRSNDPDYLDDLGLLGIRLYRKTP